MKKLQNIFLICLMATLVSCDTNNSSKEVKPKYTISFYEDGAEEISDIKVADSLIGHHL